MPKQSQDSSTRFYFNYLKGLTFAHFLLSSVDSGSRCPSFSLASHQLVIAPQHQQQQPRWMAPRNLYPKSIILVGLADWVSFYLLTHCTGTAPGCLHWFLSALSSTIRFISKLDTLNFSTKNTRENGGRQNKRDNQHLIVTKWNTDEGLFSRFIYFSAINAGARRNRSVVTSSEI